jgi:hypothetical protein
MSRIPGLVWNSGTVAKATGEACAEPGTFRAAAPHHPACTDFTFFGRAASEATTIYRMVTTLTTPTATRNGQSKSN